MANGHLRLGIPLSVIVHFYHGQEGFYGKAIRAFTRSPYSHCDISIGQETYRADPGTGVSLRRNFFHDPRDWKSIIADCDTTLAERFLVGELGCGYDYKGIFLAELLPFGLQSKSRWYCSELACATVKRAGGLPRSQRETITPGDLCQLLGALN